MRLKYERRVFKRFYTLAQLGRGPQPDTAQSGPRPRRNNSRRELPAEVQVRLAEAVPCRCQWFGTVRPEYAGGCPFCGGAGSLPVGDFRRQFGSQSEKASG